LDAQGNPVLDSSGRFQRDLATGNIVVMRKEAGFGLSDRIALELPAAESDLLGYREWIAAEVLATSVEAGDVQDVRISRA